MHIRSLAYRTDLMVRRLAGASILEREDHLVVRTPENPGFYWGNFLLLAALPAEDALEDWVEVFRHEFPGAGHVALGIDVTEVPGSLHLPSALGLEIDAGVVLTGSHPPTPGPLTSEWIVRPLRTTDDWDEELRLRLAESAEDGPLPAGHEAFLRLRTVESARLVERGWAAYFGAFIGDQLGAVVGIASDGRGVARYQNVATRSEYRRRGLASRLLAEAGVFAVSSMHAQRLVIVADDGGPAARLYGSLGFSPVEAHLGLSGSPVPHATGSTPGMHVGG